MVYLQAHGGHIPPGVIMGHQNDSGTYYMVICHHTGNVSELEYMQHEWWYEISDSFFKMIDLKCKEWYYCLLPNKHYTVINKSMFSDLILKF